MNLAEEAIADAEAKRRIFGGLNIAAEFFDIVFVERGPSRALQMSGLVDPRYPPATMRDRLLARPEIAAAIRVYRAHAAGRKMPVPARDTLLADLVEIIALAKSAGRLGVAIAGVRLAWKILSADLGDNVDQENGAKPCA